MAAERTDKTQDLPEDGASEDAPNGVADPEARAKAAAEWQRLRRDIDSGSTGEKVSYPDPAASPLGTDDEAGGAVVPPAPPGRTRTPVSSSGAAVAGVESPAQMDRNARAQPGPQAVVRRARTVLPERKRRDRMMLALGAVIGLAFFALLVAL